jgi:hypothetical protein
MRRAAQNVKQLGKQLWHKKTLIYAAFVVVGIVIGMLLGSALQFPFKAESTSPVVTSKKSLPQSKQNPQQGLEQQYQTAQRRLDQDIQAKRLTAKQAELVKKKSQELYALKKSIVTANPPDRELQSEKRKELRSWLRTNNISARYFTWF